MRKQELLKYLKAEIERLKQLRYEDLIALTEPEVKHSGEGDTFYQIEIQSFIDDPETGTLRIIVAIDDGSWRALCPLTSDFLISPSGQFL